MCVRVCNTRKCTDIGTILTIIFGSDRTRQILARKWTRARSDGNFPFIEYLARECCHVFIAKIIAREGNSISHGQRGFYFSMFAWKFFFFSWVIKIEEWLDSFFFLISIVFSFFFFFWDNFRVIIDCYKLNIRVFVHYNLLM